MMSLEKLDTARSSCDTIKIPEPSVSLPPISTKVQVVAENVKASTEKAIKEQASPFTILPAKKIALNPTTSTKPESTVPPSSERKRQSSKEGVKPPVKRQKTASEAEIVSKSKDAIKKSFADWSVKFHPKPGYWTSFVKTEEQVQAIYEQTRAIFFKKLEEASTKEALVAVLTKNQSVLKDFRKNVDEQTENDLDQVITYQEKLLKLFGAQI